MEITKNGDISILTPDYKQVDVTNAREFGEELSNLIQPTQKYILNLQKIAFLDSSGLGKIISALRKASENNSSLALCSANQAVRVLFDMVRLSQIAKIFDDGAQAEAYLRNL